MGQALNVRMIACFPDYNIFYTKNKGEWNIVFFKRKPNFGGS